MFGRQGFWQPYPIEYKRGKPKEDLSDILQLCAQAICLEEMLCCDISEGYLFYDEIHRREKVEITDELRRLLNTLFILNEETYLSLENENVIVKKDEEILGKVPLLTLENILYFGYKGVSPALIGECAKRKI